MEREGLCLDSLVLVGLGIEVDILDGRNLEVTLMARHGQEVVDDRTLQTAGRQLGLVGDLGIVVVEVLGELDVGLLEQFHVTHAADDDTQLDGVVGLDFGLVELGRDVIMAYAARKVGGTFRQRIDFDSNARCLDFLLDLDISRTAVEERLEGVDVAVLLDDDALVGNARNLELSRHLWEHDELLPSDGLVILAVDRN